MADSRRAFAKGPVHCRRASESEWRMSTITVFHTSREYRPPADPLETPEFFPMRIDTERNAMFFVQMSRDSFHESVFLDNRAVRSGHRTLLASVPKLRSRRAQTPLYVILHGAFCGSTLLARYFEKLPLCLVLKEPNLFGQLAMMEDTASPVW